MAMPEPTKAFAFQLAQQLPPGMSWRVGRRIIDNLTGRTLDPAQLDQLTNWTHCWLAVLDSPAGPVYFSTGVPREEWQ
jgi:hypothetical protein